MLLNTTAVSFCFKSGISIKKPHIAAIIMDNDIILIRISLADIAKVPVER